MLHRAQVLRVGDVGDNAGDPGLVRLRQPDLEVEPEPAGHFVPEKGAQRGARYPAYHFADQEPERQAVVTVLQTGSPEGRLRGERTGHQFPVVERARRKFVSHGGQASLVAEQHPGTDRLLAVARELRPVPAHRGIEVKVAAVGKDVRAQGRRPLGARPDDDRGVLVPGAAGFHLGGAAPQIDDGFPVHDDRHGGAGLAALGEVALELLAYLGEARVAGSLDGHGCLTRFVGARPDRSTGAPGRSSRDSPTANEVAA